MNKYLLGHSRQEHSRLEEQHALWGPALLDTLGQHGLGAGVSVMELGCGAGHLLADLASLVGPDGLARGVERDPAAAAAARERARCQVVEGDLLSAPLGGPYRLIVARWVFSFLPDPAAVIERLAPALGPGGRLVIQDYDHDGVGVWPRHPAIVRAIEAYRAAYAAAGGDMWIAAKLPQILLRLGWEVKTLTPDVRCGLPGSAPWVWAKRFLHEHLDTLVEGGHLSAEERLQFEVAWAEREQVPGALLVSPVQLTIVAKPPVRW